MIWIEGLEEIIEVAAIQKLLKLRAASEESNSNGSGGRPKTSRGSVRWGEVHNLLDDAMVGKAVEVDLGGGVT